jgi:CRISPR-associated protein Csd2
MNTITGRAEYVLLFEVTNGNPNGDPDAGNWPRQDPQTQLGLVSDVCLKRKVRNYVSMVCDEGAPDVDKPLSEVSQRYEIFVTERSILDRKQKRAWTANAMKPDKKDDYSKLPKDDKEARILGDWMCANFYDVRAFGAVMSTKGANCGQIRGPVQFSFAHSIEPIAPQEITVTRMAATTEDETKGDIRTMGRKHIVPYGLYRAHVFVSAKLAERTGFSSDDLRLLEGAMATMFLHDSAGRRRSPARFRARQARGSQ